MRQYPHLSSVFYGFSTFFLLQTVMGGPEMKGPLFQSVEAQPHNGDTQKSQALSASQVISFFFVRNFSVVGTIVFPDFRLLGDLALEDVFKDIK